MEKLQNSKLFVGLNFASAILMSFVMASTGPTLHVYFMQQVNPQLLAFVNMLTVGIAVITNGSVNSKKMLKAYHRYFATIILVDVTAFICVSVVGEYHVEVRFIGFAVINAISTAIWGIVLKNMVNNVWDGDALTKFNANSKTCGLIASFIGGGLLMFLGDNGFSVHTCIIIQCVAMTIDGINDFIIYRVYNKVKSEQDEAVEE